MRDDLHDEEQLGYQVDAWLVSLRAQGLSERRIGELARLLGEAMREGGPKTKEQERVLRRFEGWCREPASFTKKSPDQKLAVVNDKHRETTV